MRHRFNILFMVVGALLLLVSCAAEFNPPFEEGPLPNINVKPKKTVRPKKTTPIFTPGSTTTIGYPRPLSVDDIETTHRGDDLHFAWAEELRGVSISVSHLLSGTTHRVSVSDDEREATVQGITQGGVYEIVITSEYGTLVGSFSVE